MVADAFLKDRKSNRFLLSIFKSFQVMLTIMHTFITEGWDWAKMRYANSSADGFTGCHPIGIGSVTSTAVITSTIAASATSKQAERHRRASATLVTLP